MSSVLATIMGVFSYVLAGYILKKINIVPAKIEQIFSSISFNIFLPLALIVNFWLITFPNILIIKLIISFFGAGIIVFIISFFISKKIYRFKVDDSALFGLGACFGNSVALGIPLMYSIRKYMFSEPCRTHRYYLITENKVYLFFCGARGTAGLINNRKQNIFVF